jgi:hypothetical protein
MISISRLHLHVGTYFIVLKAYIKFLIAFKLYLQIHCKVFLQEKPPNLEIYEKEKNPMMK